MGGRRRKDGGEKRKKDRRNKKVVKRGRWIGEGEDLVSGREEKKRWRMIEVKYKEGTGNET